MSRAQRLTRKAAPETLREAQTWDVVKNKYLAYGLCHTCACQAAWGHQIGFSNTTRQPCDGCASLVGALPKSRPNGWRSVAGEATRNASWTGLNQVVTGDLTSVARVAGTPTPPLD